MNNCLIFFAMGRKYLPIPFHLESREFFRIAWKKAGWISVSLEKKGAIL